MEGFGAVGLDSELRLVLLREQGWAGGAAWAAQPWLLCQDQSLEVQHSRYSPKGTEESAGGLRERG